MTKNIISVLLFASISGTAGASDHVGKGFSWYDDPVVDTPQQTAPSSPKVTVNHEMKPTTSQAPSSPATPTKMSPSQELDAFHKEYNDALADFYLHPSLESSYKFQKMNKEALALDSKAADFFKQNLLLHPELNYQATHPIQQTQIHEYDLRLEKQREASAHKLASMGYGLFFAFKKTDIAQAQYSKQLNAISKEYGFPLLGVSMDGSPNPAIDEVVMNNHHLDVKVTPALILVNLHDQTDLKAVYYGVASDAQIVKNLDFILNNYQSSDLNLGRSE